MSPRHEKEYRPSRRHGPRSTAFTACPQVIGPPTDQETEFVVAMDVYKRRHNRPFPTWREAFQVLMGLGYEKRGAETPESPDGPGPTMQGEEYEI